MATNSNPKAKTKKAVEVPTLDELRAKLVAEKADLLEAKRSHAAGELVNPRVITKTRKQIARHQTAIRAAELAQVKESK